MSPSVSYPSQPRGGSLSTTAPPDMHRRPMMNLPASPTAVAAMQTRTIVVYTAPYAYARSGAPLFLEVYPDHLPQPASAAHFPTSEIGPRVRAQMPSTQALSVPISRQEPLSRNTSWLDHSPSVSSPGNASGTPTSRPPHTKLPPKGRPSSQLRLKGRKAMKALNQRTSEPFTAVPSRSHHGPMYPITKPPAQRAEHSSNEHSFKKRTPVAELYMPESAKRARRQSLPIPVNATDTACVPVANRHLGRKSAPALSLSDGTYSEETESEEDDPLVYRRQRVAAEKKPSRARRPTRWRTERAATQQGRQGRDRIMWAGPLEERFEEALRVLGVDTAMPKQILDYMAIPSLTRKHVSSHLQKYRAALDRERERVRSQLGERLPVSSSPVEVPCSSSGRTVVLPPRKQTWVLPPISSERK